MKSNYWFRVRLKSGSSYRLGNTVIETRLLGADLAEVSRKFVSWLSITKYDWEELEPSVLGDMATPDQVLGRHMTINRNGDIWQMKWDKAGRELIRDKILYRPKGRWKKEAA